MIRQAKKKGEFTHDSQMKLLIFYKKIYMTKLNREKTTKLNPFVKCKHKKKLKIKKRCEMRQDKSKKIV